MDRRERMNDPEEAFRAAFEGLAAGLWTALPGIVQTFDAARMTVTAQPAIKGRVKHPDGVIELVDMPLLVDVPLVFPSGGGFTLTFPVAQGDECLVKFADRCIDAWWQSGGTQPPAELRMHDLSDGFALVGIRSLPRVLSGVSTTAVQLRDDAGSTLVEVAGGGVVRVVAPTKVRLETPLLEVTGDVVAGTVSLKTHVHANSGGTGNSGQPVP